MLWGNSYMVLVIPQFQDSHSEQHRLPPRTFGRAFCYATAGDGAWAKGWTAGGTPGYFNPFQPGKSDWFTFPK